MKIRFYRKKYRGWNRNRNIILKIILNKTTSNQNNMDKIRRWKNWKSVKLKIFQFYKLFEIKQIIIKRIEIKSGGK